MFYKPEASKKDRDKYRQLVLEQERTDIARVFSQKESRTDGATQVRFKAVKFVCFEFYTDHCPPINMTRIQRAQGINCLVCTLLYMVVDNFEFVYILRH